MSSSTSSERYGTPACISNCSAKERGEQRQRNVTREGISPPLPSPNEREKQANSLPSMLLTADHRVPRKTYRRIARPSGGVRPLILGAAVSD